jgi:predicted secreted protein
MPLILPNAPQFTRYESHVTASPPASTTYGTTVNNPAGAAHTKDTTWTQLIAASAFDAQLVVVNITSSSASNTNTSTLIDIGIGAAAAETVIIPDLLGGYCAAVGSVPGPRSYIFPLYIPAGSRISARAQSIRTTGSASVLVQLWGGPRNPDAWWCGQQVTAYGINAADSGAVAVTAGNSGAETASPVSIGTTSAIHKALVLGVSGNTNSYTALGYYWDVGIDTASTSWLIRDAYYYQSQSTEATGPAGQVWWPIFQNIPSGTVLVAGGECSGVAESHDIAIYGVS